MALSLRAEERRFRRDVSDSAHYRSWECSYVKVRKMQMWSQREEKKSVLPVLSPYPESEDALNTSITESAALKHEDVSGSAFRRVRIMFSQSYRSGCTVRVKVKVLKSCHYGFLELDLIPELCKSRWRLRAIPFESTHNRDTADESIINGRCCTLQRVSSPRLQPK